MRDLFGGSSAEERPPYPEWLSDLDEGRLSGEDRAWVRLGDAAMLGLAEVCQMRGRFGDSIERLESLAEHQAARGAEPSARLFVLTLLRDIARRYDPPRAVAPIVCALEIQRDEVGKEEAVTELERDLFELLCTLQRHTDVSAAHVVSLGWNVLCVVRMVRMVRKVRMVHGTYGALWYGWYVWYVVVRVVRMVRMVRWTACREYSMYSASGEYNEYFKYD